VKAPEKVEGQVVKMELAQSRVSVRESGGTFEPRRKHSQISKGGDRIEAKLREAPKCL
jgi:hypothetical protein